MPFTFATIKTRVAEILEDASFTQWSRPLVGQYVNDAANAAIAWSKISKTNSTFAFAQLVVLGDLNAHVLEWPAI